MSINVRVYDNGDHTCLVWLPADGKPIAQCRGFTIRRVVQGSPDVYLHGFVGFSDTDKLDLNNPWKHPVQRFMWYDYGVKPGQVVQYSVVPVTGDKDHLQLASALASGLTEKMTISGQQTPHVSAYFNKGIVAAQWVSRVITSLGKPPPKMADLIAATQPPKNALRNALSGLLRPQLLAMLDDVKAKGGEIYAALYELNDPELIDRLKALGQKCHLILANGAFKPANHNDENSDIRGKLRGVVDLHDRIVTGNHFAHNKFVVCCDAQGNPQRVLSGSTNWTMTGLCTQANNGIIVDDPKLGQYFIDEWNQLKAAGNAYPPTLAAFNSTSKTFNVDNGTITQWFAPTNGGPDLDYARKLINGAKEGILFLFFNPGKIVAEGQPENKWTLLQNILFRHRQGAANFDAGLYIRGVVNQEIAGLTESDSDSSSAGAGHAGSGGSVKDPAATPVTLYSGGAETAQHFGYDSMVPQAIKDTFHNWAKESLGSGVHVHSKVVVIDPFGEHPVVMTGSHNLGFKASSSNDDNLMIVEGNARLAAAYAINIIAIYQSYRWNTNVGKHGQDATFWHGLEDDDTWQNGYLTGDHLSEYQFWLGTPVTAGGAMAPPASGGPAAKTAVAGPAPVQTRPRTKKAAATKKSPAKKPARKKPVKKAAAKKRASTKRSAKKTPKKKRAKMPKKKAAKAKKSKKR